MKNLVTLIGLALSWQEVPAAIRTELVEYRQGGTSLEGLLVFDDSSNAARPGALVAHKWKGITDYEKKRATMLANLGYTVFVADIYGKGVRPDSPGDAAALADKSSSRKCARPVWTGNWWFMGAPCTASPTGTLATTTPKARLTTNEPTNVPGRR